MRVSQSIKKRLIKAINDADCETIADIFEDLGNELFNWIHDHSDSWHETDAAYEWDSRLSDLEEYSEHYRENTLVMKDHLLKEKKIPRTEWILK